jgi:hypothetical protein
MNREQWLSQAAQRLAQDILAPASLTCPTVRVSCGFPSRSALSSKAKRIGECWDGSSCKDGTPQLFISPILADPVRVLDVLTHELIHAAIGCRHKHDKTFAKAARACGLIGKPTSTEAGPELAARLNTLAATLGPYPHAAIVPTVKPKQTTRLRLWECSCGVKVRVASDTFSAHCDDCETPFELAASK